MAFNRGLSVLAKSVTYDNQANTIDLELDNPLKHGVLDGGHTLAVILDRKQDQVSNQEVLDREDFEEDGDDSPHCRLEIMTGVPSDMIQDLVEARNTSRQVASKSLLNLGGQFEPLKQALGSTISENISWRENQDGDVDVREVLALLTAFDLTHYSDMQHPIQAYSGKEWCLKHFESNPECYEKLYPVAKDILRLWDEIQSAVPDQYNKETGGRFGGLKACEPLKRARKLPIIGGETAYPFPSGYLLPIVAAFRSMLVESPNGDYRWGKGVDPNKIVRDGLANRIFSGPVLNSIKSHRNPNRTGKDTNVWALAYQIAENHYLRSQQ